MNTRTFIEENLREIDASLKVERLQSVGGGCINAATKVMTSQGNFFVKWNAHAPSDLFLAEAACLTELREATQKLKIPKVYLATEITAAQPGILVMEFLEAGKPNDTLLGEGLAEIHQFTAKTFGFKRATYCGATLQDNTAETNWITFYGERRLRPLLRLVEHSQGLSRSEWQLYERVIDQLPQWLPAEPPPALVHGDLWSGNYLYASEAPALIDPACCYAAREFEFGITTMFGGFSVAFWEAYQHYYPLEKEWRMQNELYQLYHYLNHYHLFGGGYGRSALQIARRFA